MHVSGNELEKKHPEIVEELKKLVDNKIIKNLDFTADSMVEMSCKSRIYSSKEVEYRIEDIILKIDGKTIIFNREERTGKILDVFCEDAQIISTEGSKEETLLNYVSYLGLNIVDDWICEENILKSYKTGMMVVSATSGDFSFIAINSMIRIKDAPAGIFEK